MRKTVQQGACAIIYGPVHSRRHGLSLGVNLGNPFHKVCSWGCLYCQCGMGQRSSERELDLPSKEKVLEELTLRLQECGEIDSVTFAGNSEPALHPQFLEIVQEVQNLRHRLRGHWVLNGLTNGSQLDDDRVVTACQLLDEAWVKLDCATEELFQKLNRPIAHVGSLKKHLKRIQKLKPLRIQTLLWECKRDPGLANWNLPNRLALLSTYCELNPLEVHVTTLSRQPASAGLSAILIEDLEAFSNSIRAQGILVKAFA